MSKRPPSSKDRPFRDAFKSFAGRVRRRLALERMLSGAAVGLVLGAGAAGAAWQTRHGALRPWMAAGGALGAAAGAIVARRKRWRDEEVALYLDGRLGGKESISTAIELDREDERDDPARAVVLSQATTVLEKANPKDARPRFVRAYHLAIPIGLAAIGYVSFIPLPALPPPPAAPPGAEQVKLADIKGLDKIIELANTDARDEAQRKRLDKIAEDAKKLREKLREGMEKREAQAEIGKLKDAITAERLSLGDGEQRQGLESALGKLAENPDLKDAAKALGDRDLVSFDDAMESLANKLEKEDRERAKKTLEEAAEAARKQNAPDVAKAIEEQKKRLEDMAKKNEKLKELGKAIGEGLSDDAKEALKDLDSGKGGGKEQQKLAEKLEEALGKLTPEQRKQLAENMKKRAAEMSGEEAPGEGPSKEQLQELAEELESEEGQKRLAEELKKMAEPEGEGSEEGERQKRLEDAQKGAGEAEGQLGGAPMPVPMQGGQGNKPGQNGNKPGDKPGDKNGSKNGGPGSGGKDEGQPFAGHSEGGGPGDHKGQTGVVDGQGVKARATGPINKGKPMPGLVMGRTTGRAGESANIQGTGALGQAAAGELGAIERSDVPEEYREQVGRYFQPK